MTPLASSHTCVAAVGPELWHLGPLVQIRIVHLPAAQLIRVAVGATHHVQLTLIGCGGGDK